MLVAGGAGAVGHFAIEFAAWGGAARVASTASNPDKAELARQAGAGHVVNYRDPDAARQITDSGQARWTASSRWRSAQT